MATFAWAILLSACKLTASWLQESAWRSYAATAVELTPLLACNVGLAVQVAASGIVVVTGCSPLLLELLAAALVEVFQAEGRQDSLGSCLVPEPSVLAARTCMKDAEG